MSDSTFETLLTGQLREYAEAGVRPIDRYAIAEAIISHSVAAGTQQRGSALASPLAISGRPAERRSSPRSCSSACSSR